MNQLFQTSRLNLRRLSLSDFACLRELESNPFIMQFAPSRVPQTEEQTRARLESQIAKGASLEPFGIWVGFTQAENTFVGWYMLMPTAYNELELGFMAPESQWGKGYTTEAGLALIHYAQKLAPEKSIIAKTNIENLASRKLLKKLGFKQEKNVLVEATELNFFRFT